MAGHRRELFRKKADGRLGLLRVAWKRSSQAARTRRPQGTEAVAQTGSVRSGYEHSGMAQNFIEGRREQGFLLPPDVRDWLPADHLAWFVIEAVAEMDLSAF